MPEKEEKPKKSRYFQTAERMDEALLLLLEKKDFPYISVKEICQKAGVNRSTFYLHYETMEDLLQETTALITERFLSYFHGGNDSEDIVLQDRYLTTGKYLIPYLTFVKENKRVFRLVALHPSLFNGKATYQKLEETIFYPILDTVEVPEKEKPYVLEFYVKGTLSLINKWLDNDCKDDIEFIAMLIERFTRPKS
ncbi:MAG: TetR/AcrR family transcriptional regulator [Eubacteriales bacterium]|nr:TetR/AcrR family transcriptional regulator [Eubacteriales bacterium]